MKAERIYQLLLRAYPPQFRATYGHEMVLLFKDQYRDKGVRTLAFWTLVFWDVVRSAPALRAEAWREALNAHTRTVEVVMKIAALLTVLLAAFGIVGGVTEWIAAPQHAGVYALAVVLGIVGSVLLLGAAVAILLQRRQAARLVLFASLVSFVAARLLFPWMGIFIQLVGFGMPVALLIALYWPRQPSNLRAPTAR